MILKVFDISCICTCEKRSYCRWNCQVALHGSWLLFVLDTHLLVLDCPWILVPWYQIVVVNVDLSSVVLSGATVLQSMQQIWFYILRFLNARFYNLYWGSFDIHCFYDVLRPLAFWKSLLFCMLLVSLWVFVGTCVWLNACNSACAAFHSRSQARVKEERCMACNIWWWSYIMLHIQVLIFTFALLIYQIRASGLVCCLYAPLIWE